MKIQQNPKNTLFSKQVSCSEFQVPLDSYKTTTSFEMKS